MEKASAGVKYEPHWWWAVAFVFVPLTLVGIAFFGVPVGSGVSSHVAEVAPMAAVVVSGAGMTVTLMRRQKVLIGLAALGAIISVAGLLWIRWIT